MLVAFGTTSEVVMTVTVPRVPLLSGAEIPVLGLGTWPMDDAEAERVIAKAIALGYRSFDTAFNYRNETGVGRGLAAAGVPREELFVTTKFNAEWHGVDLVKEAFEDAASRLGVDYLDCLMIHWPNPAQDRYIDAWRGLIRLRDEGLVRAIGVSNFKVSHLERILAETGVAPDLNQVQCDPRHSRPAVRAFDAEHGIVTESWSPLGQGRGLLETPVVQAIAERLGHTPAQVVLRWHLELGLVAIPKTSTPEHLEENLGALAISLSPGDLEALATLDEGDVGTVDSDSFGH
jgi:2,5-diketo-D-gluconate reductase A